MAGKIQEIRRKLDTENHTCPSDYDAAVNLDDFSIFGGVDASDCDEDLIPTNVSVNSFNSLPDDKKAAKPICHRRHDSTGMKARIAPVPMLIYSPTASTGPLRLSNDKLGKATFPPDSPLVSPGPEDDYEAIPPPRPLNQCWATPPPKVFRKSLVFPSPPPPPEQAVVTPPCLKKRKKAPTLRAPRSKEPKTPPPKVFRKRMVVPSPPPPPEQAIVTPPRLKKRKKAPTLLASRTKEPKTKQNTTKTSVDVLLGKTKVAVFLQVSCQRFLLTHLYNPCDILSMQDVAVAAITTAETMAT
jgi:hypothetical protein